MPVGGRQSQRPRFVTFEVQCDRLFQVRDSLIQRPSLRHDGDLETFGGVPAFGAIDRRMNRAAQCGRGDVV